MDWRKGEVRKVLKGLTNKEQTTNKQTKTKWKTTNGASEQIGFEDFISWNAIIVCEGNGIEIDKAI